LRSRSWRSLLRGYNIGVRLIDEFLAKSHIPHCQDFKETTENIAKVRPGFVCARFELGRFLQVAFKMFLGVTAEVTQWNADFTACSLILHENPLAGNDRWAAQQRTS
jgi:hypothetical protein